MEREFPDDENGDVLRRMASQGDDLDKPRDIDFEHTFGSTESALAFAAYVLNQRDTVRISWYDAHRCWNVCVTRHMVPDHEEISKLEASLQEIAHQHGGKADGWGCFQVKTSDP